MNQEQKKAAIETYLTAKGIAMQMVAGEITKLANSVPPATVQEQGLVTEIDKAYAAYLIESGQGLGVTTTTGASTAPVEGLSAADTRMIGKQLLAEHDARATVSNSARVEALIFDRPNPSDYIKATDTMVINKNAFDKIDTKIQQGEYILNPDDDENKNTTIYNSLKAAMNAGTPVAIYIGDASKRAVGYELSVPTATGKGTETKSFNRNGVIRYLTMYTNGFILASKGKPGLALKYVEPKSTEAGASKPAYTALAEGNKADAIAAGNVKFSRDIVAAQTKAMTVKSNEYFTVTLKGEVKKDGTPKTRKIRVSGQATLPTLRRKAEYAAIFGGETDDVNNLMVAPSEEKMQKINNAQKLELAKLISMRNEGSAQIADVDAKLSAFVSAAEAEASKGAPKLTI